MPPLRVVLDTNVVVSTLVFSSRALSWLPPAWREGFIKPLVTPATLLELVDVLGYDKFGIAVERRLELIGQYEPWCQLVIIPDPPPQVPECRDADDRKFLELALFAGADAPVAGDRGLLTLAPFFSIPIITPDRLRSQLPVVN